MSKTKKIRRQIEKQNTEEVKEVTLNNKEDYFKLLKLIIAIVVFLGLAYVYTRTFITKDWTEPVVVEPEPTIDYDTIVAKQALNQPEDVYFVIYTDDASVEQFINYKNDELVKSLIKLYRVDTTDVFNKGIVTDGEYTLEPKNVDELMVGKVPSLIKVENGVVTEFVEGDFVLDYLSILVSTAQDK